MEFRRLWHGKSLTGFTVGNPDGLGHTAACIRNRLMPPGDAAGQAGPENRPDRDMAGLNDRGHMTA